VRFDQKPATQARSGAILAHRTDAVYSIVLDIVVLPIQSPGNISMGNGEGIAHASLQEAKTLGAA
jgi:uncharacterized membrane protein